MKILFFLNQSWLIEFHNKYFGKSLWIIHKMSETRKLLHIFCHYLLHDGRLIMLINQISLLKWIAKTFFPTIWIFINISIFFLRFYLSIVEIHTLYIESLKFSLLNDALVVLVLITSYLSNQWPVGGGPSTWFVVYKK